MIAKPEVMMRISKDGKMAGITLRLSVQVLATYVAVACLVNQRELKAGGVV
jgi:hypothetical protein